MIPHFVFIVDSTINVRWESIIFCTLEVPKNYSKNKHWTQSNQRHRFTSQFPNSTTANIPKTQIFSSTHCEPSLMNPKPSGLLRMWTHEIHGGGDTDDEFSCSSLSLSLCFFLPLLDLRFFLCIHVVYNLFNLLSLFWLFCLGCPMWFTFQCIRDFSCNRQHISPKSNTCALKLWHPMFK